MYCAAGYVKLPAKQATALCTGTAGQCLAVDDEVLVLLILERQRPQCARSRPLNLQITGSSSNGSPPCGPLSSLTLHALQAIRLRAHICPCEPSIRIRDRQGLCIIQADWLRYHEHVALPASTGPVNDLRLTQRTRVPFAALYCCKWEGGARAAPWRRSSPAGAPEGRCRPRPARSS